MEDLKNLLADLKNALYECKTCCATCKHNKTMEDKKTEWSIYQSLKKLGVIDDSNDEPQKERENEN